MNSVSRLLLSASICAGLSSAAYAQSATTTEAAKPTAAGDHAKHKGPAVEKHKPAAPAESVSADKSKPAEHSAKPAQPAAAPKADKSAIGKPVADKVVGASKPTPDLKPAAKPAKAAAKAEPAAETTKPVK